MNKKVIKRCFEEIITEGLGLDLSDPNLKDTPSRVANMFVDELFVGLKKTAAPNITVFPNSHAYSQMIVSDKIYFSSVCSHHFLTFSGFAWVLHIPNNTVVGLSKFTRIVDFFARRPQLQENLTEQIRDYLVKKTDPLGVMVVIRASHQCMVCRGVKQQSGAGMVTSAIYGEFEKPEVRAEGLSLIHLSMK